MLLENCLLNMLFVALVILALPLKSRGACDSWRTSIPELGKRSRLYKASDVNDVVDDAFLDSDWYNAFTDGKQYLIPDNRTIPSLNRCGGYYPIYLLGFHPNISTLDDNAVDITACVKTDIDVCAYTLDLEIRQCEGMVQYYLFATFVRASSFCFDPSDIYGRPESDFTDVPAGVSVGNLTVVPTLEHANGLPNVKLLCHLSNVQGSVSNLLVHTYWYINEEVAYHFTANGSTTPLTEKELAETGLGKTISCSVQLAKSNFGKLTDLVASKDYYAGIKVLDRAIDLVKEADGASIRLERTLPFGCRQVNAVGSPRCSFAVQMIYNEICTTKGTLAGKNVKGVSANQQKCGVEFPGITEGEDINAVDKARTMKVSTIDLTVSDPRSYVLQMKVQTKTDHNIWNNYVLEPVIVTIHDDLKYSQKICRANNDPHMTTFMGYPYEHQHPEDSIMYRNVKYQAEVQIRTKSCNNNLAYCICAVAIRAGGDVFLVNYCSDNLKNWIQGMTSCKDGGIISMNLQDGQYTFHTPIGTMISLTIYKWSGMMDVNILMAPKDLNNADGLCGRPGAGPDIADRDGNPTNDQRQGRWGSYHDKFSEAWKVKPTDKNYLDAKCYPDATDWAKAELPLYCVCEKCLGSSCTQGYVSEAHCSPSQYLDCPVKATVSKEQCKICNSRCSNNVAENSKKEYTGKQIRRRRFQETETKMHRRDLQKRDVQNYTEEESEQLCADVITSHPALTHVPDATGGFNVTQNIMNCAFDTFTGQTDEWILGYSYALTDVVEMNLEKDPDYAVEHADDILAYRRLSCPSNCSGNGICTDQGKCSCSDRFSGSDCSIDTTAELEIYGVLGSEVCEITGSGCSSMEIRTFDIVEGYVCKVAEKQILTTGIKVITSTEVNKGYYTDFFTAQCLLPNKGQNSGTTKNVQQKSDYFFAYEYDVSISNDGNTFSESVSVVVYDPACQGTEKNSDGTFNVFLMPNTCFINGSCYTALDTSVEDPCYLCIPKSNSYSWSDGCSETPSTSDNEGLPLYAILTLAIAPAIIIVAIVLTAFCLCKKKNFPIRTVSPGPANANFKQYLSRHNTDDLGKIIVHRTESSDPENVKFNQTFSLSRQSTTDLGKISISELD